MEKCNHDSKRLNDIKTVKLYMESGCGNVTAEEAAGDSLCFPALVKIQLLLPFFICWIPVNIDYMLLLSFPKLKLQVEKLHTTTNVYFLIIDLFAIRINCHLPGEHMWFMSPKDTFLEKMFSESLEKFTDLSSSF